MAARLTKASVLINDSEPALSQKDIDIALQCCTILNVPSLVGSLLQRRASLAASTYNLRTPLHYAARNNHLELLKIFIKQNAPIDAVDISGYTPLDLSLGKGLGNVEATRYLIDIGALAVQGRDQDMVSIASTQSTLEGPWEGTYTYNSWLKGMVEPTALTIGIDPGHRNSEYPSWNCSHDDRIGRFEVMGHLFADNTVRFVKLYKSFGWLYLGVFDPDAMIIRGTWGSSMAIRHGSFEIKKLEAPASDH